MIKVETQGFGEFSKRLKEAAATIPPEVEREVAAHAKEFVARAVRTHTTNGGNNGTLARSIGDAKAGEFSYDVFVGAFYAPFIEFGTKGKYKAIPGTEAVAAQFKGYKRGNFAQMLESLKSWVKRKGIAKGKEIDGAAFAIAKSILRNGIRPQPFFYQHMGPIKTSLENRIKVILNGL